MIVSASRRTDIPAFYASWFEHRLRAGFCEVANPFNPRQVARVSLRREDVDAIVLWTRHARPFLGVLSRLQAEDHRILCQYTITGYGSPVERRTPSVPVAVAAFRELAARLPPGAVVWRYDPILVGPAFPAARQVETFDRIAAGLEGHARRVVVSIVDVYAKTRRRLGTVLRWGEDLAPEPAAWPGLDDLLGRLVSIAEDHGLAVEACAEPRDLTALGITSTKCIDDALLGTLYGGTWSRTKDRGQRASCRCIPSRDIGRTDTCIFGCRYCYATRSDGVARERHVAHDPRAVRLCD